MPGGILPYRSSYISEECQEYLNGFDLRIGTLECAVGDNLPFDEVKMNGKQNIIYSRCEDLQRVMDMKFDVVSIANNHTFDLGAKGLEATISQLKENGIKFCGAGKNIEEASKPAVVQLNDKRIAFFAYCQYGSVYIGHLKKATETESGINPLDIERCIEDIKNAKQWYDYVFVLPHWGIEYQFLPTVECHRWAKMMIDAGADGVFASHTHQVQPVIKYKKRPIAFSMGNFMFPDYYMQPPRPIWYPEAGFDDKELSRVKFYPKHIDKPCIQVWRHLSRIGMMITYDDSDNKNIINNQFVYLQRESNCLELYVKSKAIGLRMYWMGLMTKSLIYPSLYSIYCSKYNLLRRGWHFISRLLNEK